MVANNVGHEEEKDDRMMDAVRYHGPNQPLVLEKVAVPEIGPDDVLVEVKAAALCHTELHFADGTLNLGVLPITMGHEVVGFVSKCGSNVSSDRIGERVIVYYYVGCGKTNKNNNSMADAEHEDECRWCADGQEQICPSLKAEFGFVSDGGLANYLSAPARNAVVLPDNIRFEDAAPIGCGVTTAVHCANLANVKENDWAVVYGTNGVGFGLVQLLKNKYKARVIAISRSADKLEKAKELGADAVVDGADASAVGAAVREIIGGGEGADVIFECVGNRTTMDACVGWTGILGRRGRLILVGYHAGIDHEFRCHPLPLIVYEQSIIGSVGATLDDLKEAVALVSSGQVKTVVDSVVPLSQFQEGLDKIKDCSCVGKVVCTV